MTGLSGFIGKKLVLKLQSEVCSIVASTRLNADAKLFFIPTWFIEVVSIYLGKKPACIGLYGSLQLDISKAHEQDEWLRQFIFLMDLKKSQLIGLREVEK